MYHHSSPTGLCHEYEARVARAVLKQGSRHDAQPATRPHASVWHRFRGWLISARDYLERQLQPAEPEGYIA
jgi:hypothetical protein